MHIGRQCSNGKAHAARPRRLLPFTERCGGLRSGKHRHVHVEQGKIKRLPRRHLRHCFAYVVRRQGLLDKARCCAEAGEQSTQRCAAVRHRDDVKAAQLQQASKETQVERKVVLRAMPCVRTSASERMMRDVVVRRTATRMR